MKLYILIQQLLRRKFIQYFVLFFILISIIAVIASSFEEMATYKVLLFGITYVSSFIFLIEYTARIVSAPALYPGMKTAKARLKYTFSFYGFVDFVAVLPCVLTYAYWDTEVVHVIILPYIFIPFNIIHQNGGKANCNETSCVGCFKFFSDRSKSHTDNSERSRVPY